MGGSVIWITGLSGAGKSTLAELVRDQLRSLGESVVLLDGDELRSVLYTNLEHDAGGRLALAKRYSRLCRLLAEQGHVVVIATISMFHDIHAWNRVHLPNYLEVYLKVPVSELRRRDSKGIYRRYDSGELTNVAGLDLAVDEPVSPDLTIQHSPQRGPETAADELLSAWRNRSPK